MENSSNIVRGLDDEQLIKECRRPLHNPGWLTLDYKAILSPCALLRKVGGGGGEHLHSAGDCGQSGHFDWRPRQSPKQKKKKKVQRIFSCALFA